jgi:hypothetical protein
MLGIRTITASTLLLISTIAVSAQTADYFPLQVGNSWVYKTSLGRTNRVQTVSVDAIENVDGRDYYRVDFFGSSVLVRPGDNRSLLSYDAGAKRERLWLPFGAPEGQPTESEFDSCSRSATVRSRSANVKGPIGEFNNALQLTYTPVCADAGVTTQFFLPYIGLVQQESTSFAGPQRYELIYSRTGFTNVDAGQIGFTMALDSNSYKAGQDAEIVVRLTLRNSNREPITLVFPSGQSFDLKIYNERGEIVYTWSADKLFIQAFRTEKLGPGERSWALTAPIGQLPPGRYAAQGFLTTQPLAYSAIVHFDVVR